mgnify:FL=1
MSRKPHNYVHFKALVNELKEQNEHNFASFQTHLEVHTDVLQSMKGIILKGVQQKNAILKEKNEITINNKETKIDNPKPSLSEKNSEGMSNLANVLSTKPSLSEKNSEGMSNLANVLSTTLLNTAVRLKEQLNVLNKLFGFLQSKDKDDLRRDKEDRLEVIGKKNSIFKNDKTKPSGKGFMRMLGNFLSTALIGIPGGLRKFLPATLGLALIPKLAKGIALMVAGPALIKALEAGFDQKTFSGGVTSFIDTYFAPSGKGYTSLAMAASGGAGKAAIVGFGLLGPRGAVIAGVLGGALSGLNHIFAEDKSKMNSKNVMTKVKEHLMENIGLYAGGGMALMGARWGAKGGPAGMIAGAILGAGIGIIGAGTIKEMMKVEEAGEKDVGKAFKQGLKNYLMSNEFDGSALPWAGGFFGAAAFSGFGPAGMIAGMILGAGAGIIGGPVLAEALKAQKGEGGSLAGHMKTQLWKYLQNSTYLKHALLGAGLFGGTAMLGLGPVGLVAGIVIGGAIGIIATWVGKALEDIIGTTGANSVMGKLFGKETSGLSNKYKKMRDAQDADEENASTHTLGLLRADPKSGVGQNAKKLLKAYAIAAKELGVGMGKYDASAAVLASKRVSTGFVGKVSGSDTDTTNKEEAQFLRLNFQRKKILELERERNESLKVGQPAGTTNIYNDSSMKLNTNVTADRSFTGFPPGLLDTGIQ